MELPGFIFPILRRIRIPSRLHWHLVRAINTRFLLGVAGVITNEAGQLLLFEHTYRRSFPWGMPGGWMEASESPLRALEREVLEESGLIAQSQRLLLIGTTPDRPKIEFIVGATIKSGTFRPSREVRAMRWFDLNALPPLAPFHLHILDQLQHASDSPGWYEAPWKIAHP